MAKTRTRYLCSDCGAESASWLGRCPACGEYGTMKELNRVLGRKASSSLDGVQRSGEGVRALSEISRNESERRSSGISELDRILGGGFVPGSVILVGGDPGIGKSTLLMQTAQAMAEEWDQPVLYVSGEESPGQVRIRAERLQALHGKLLFLASTDLAEASQAAREHKPSLMIMDSVQTLTDPDHEGVSGAASQLRQVTSKLSALAKEEGFPLVLIGHVTKDGQIAGPRVLEHMVDAVLYFEGETRGTGRILRTVKNRFGASHEVALFEMRNNGLEAILDPSSLLGGSREGAVGSAVAVTWTGSRPLAVEIQALVSATRYGTPARVVQGLDSRRVSLLVAVLEKCSGMQLGGSDIFVSVAGGLKLDDPALDAALIAALASSFTSRSLPSSAVFLGETGLRGDLRPVSQVNERCREAERLGFSSVFAASAGQDLPAGVQGLSDVPALLRAAGVLQEDAAGR
ncbi:MAG: DNA repair protein RadA [Candidatus Krumholzibacteria bacterium]|nr:DNA repair protein RadA [Candidatus Krumholzibacteria bacterium]